MRKISITSVAAMSALVLALLVAPVEARPNQSGNAATQGEGRASMDPDRAAERVQQSTGGRVLAVETVVEKGRTLYLVKVLLPGGRLRIVTVDGETGKTR